MQYLIRVRLFNGRFWWFPLKFCGRTILHGHHEDKHRGWLGNTGHWKMSWPFLGPNLNLPQLLCLPVVRFGECFLSQISLYILTIYCIDFFFNSKKLSPIFVSPTGKKNQGKMTQQPKSPSGLRPSSPLVPEVEPPPLPQVLWTPWAWFRPCRPCRRKVREPREGEG